MATRSEQEHDAQQRRGQTAKAKKRSLARKSRAEKFGTEHATKRAGGKASYALERPSRTGRASRKSTRGGANRSKRDANMDLREQRTKGSPEARFRRARAKATRARGRPAGAPRARATSSPSTS
jgi:hypothetical protein